MANDENKYEIEARLRKRWGRTQTQITTGTIGDNVEGILTEEGINQLLDGLKLERLQIVSEEAG